MVRCSCVYYTWQSNHQQHAMKTDIDQELRFLLTPTPSLGGYPLEYFHNVWYRKTRMVRLSDDEKFWRYVYSFWHNTWMWQTDRQTDAAWRHSLHLCIALRDKNVIGVRFFETHCMHHCTCSNRRTEAGDYSHVQRNSVFLWYKTSKPCHAVDKYIPHVCPVHSDSHLFTSNIISTYPSLNNWELSYFVYVCNSMLLTRCNKLRRTDTK